MKQFCIGMNKKGYQLKKKKTKSNFLGKNLNMEVGMTSLYQSPCNNIHLGVKILCCIYQILCCIYQILCRIYQNPVLHMHLQKFKFNHIKWEEQKTKS